MDPSSTSKTEAADLIDKDYCRILASRITLRIKESEGQLTK
jgi:hypothetical protein